MGKILEVKPLLVAAAIGAVLVAFILVDEESTWQPWVYGAVVGAGVQVGVRLIGVS